MIAFLHHSLNRFVCLVQDYDGKRALLQHVPALASPTLRRNFVAILCGPFVIREIREVNAFVSDIFMVRQSAQLVVIVIAGGKLWGCLRVGPSGHVLRNNL